MEQLTHEDYKNILALINLADIKGVQATTVVILQQKINKILNAEDKTSENVTDK